MSQHSFLSIIIGIAITLTATCGFSGEAEITLKHGTAQPNNDHVKASTSEPLVPHYGSFEDKRIETSTTNSSNRQKYGPVLKVKPQGFLGIEPDEID